DGEPIQGKDIPLEKASGLEIIDSGANNWKRGQSWTEVMGSVKRHIAAWERGEDMDQDPVMKTKHLANAAWGLFSILTYYSTQPEYDDRDHSYLRPKRIGLDIDEVLCNWVGDWTDKFDMQTPTSWYFDRDILERFETMKKKNELDKFFLSLKPLVKPKDIPFEPHCYITSRPVDASVTEQWLSDHGFPARPVHTVGVGKSKVDIAKKQKLDIFVDDGYHNFLALNKAGICCYLMDAPHNRRYDVGHKRIRSLSELKL
ncbi:MAG: hypothetical protein HKN45_01825, partial [Flavobacteriales bacterium]|nr:hypothetical protein [Flavobacteriales bacterium]